MTTTLTPAEALRALADGKTLVYRATVSEITASLRGGRLLCSDGMPVVILNDWTIAEDPNPHPVGSWHWAGFEYGRGKVVRRQCCLPFKLSTYLWEQHVFTGTDFTATDWEIAE